MFSNETAVERIQSNYYSFYMTKIARFNMRNFQQKSERKKLE